MSVCLDRAVGDGHGPVGAVFAGRGHARAAAEVDNICPGNAPAPPLIDVAAVAQTVHEQVRTVAARQIVVARAADDHVVAGATR